MTTLLGYLNLQRDLLAAQYSMLLLIYIEQRPDSRINETVLPRILCHHAS